LKLIGTNNLNQGSDAILSQLKTGREGGRGAALSSTVD
jgi:hypothetical protein